MIKTIIQTMETAVRAITQGFDLDLEDYTITR